MIRKVKTPLSLALVVLILFLVMHFKFFEVVRMDNENASQNTRGVNNSLVEFEEVEKKPTERSHPEKNVCGNFIRNGPPIQEYRRIQSQNNTFAVGYNDPRVPSWIEDTPSDDKRLVDVIRKIWIEPPSTKPYNLTGPPELRAQFYQDEFVDELLNHKRNGFFIEAGAADGETISNTLSFELERNWTGLLVEPDPIAYSMLKTKHRKAFAINACLASEVTKVQFSAYFLLGGVNAYSAIPRKKRRPTNATVYCFPLHSILEAIGHTTVDFFSLDVEGAEPYVLKGIDFEKVDIKVLSIEANHCGHKAISDILVPAGYKMVKRVKLDDVYIKEE
ncbi:hypothetical protein ScPMuIL_011238 [Solemya velum]